MIPHRFLLVSVGLTVTLMTALGCGGGPEVCSTNSAWEEGDDGSPLMHPGDDCIACHSSNEGPKFALAGTVMNDYKDDIDCNGVSGVTVEITDANGKVTSLTSNAAGNFYIEGAAVATPYTAKITKDGRERVMTTAQVVTACNSCHTETGASAAPGRILAP